MYEIEFEDHGQDILTLQCDKETGEIKQAGFFRTHNELYASGDCFVDTKELLNDRVVHYTRNGEKRSFRWLMTKLSLDGKVLAEVK